MAASTRENPLAKITASVRLESGSLSICSRKARFGLTRLTRLSLSLSLRLANRASPPNEWNHREETKFQFPSASRWPVINSDSRASSRERAEMEKVAADVVRNSVVLNRARKSRLSRTNVVDETGRRFSGISYALGQEAEKPRSQGMSGMSARATAILSRIRCLRLRLFASASGPWTMAARSTTRWPSHVTHLAEIVDVGRASAQSCAFRRVARVRRRGIIHVRAMHVMHHQCR